MAGLIGHEAIARELALVAGFEEPPHALLFAGPEGTGRAYLARHYAMLLNCTAGQDQGGMFGGLLADDNTSRPCGACRACRLILDGTHPDVVVVRPGDTLCKPRSGDSSHARHPDARDIRICQVRGIIEAVARFPFEARYRVLILDPAERMTQDAANTLLKTLEEPPGHTVFALISAAPDAVIETVRSRCRRIDVPLLARDVITAGLREHGYGEWAEAAAAAARGRPGRALRFAREPGLMGDHERLIKRCSRLAAGGLPERFRYAQELQERWRNDRTLVAGDLDAWEAFWEGRLRDAAPGDTQAARDALASLRAVGRARLDLLANCQARPVFDLMLLTFPRVSMEGSSEESMAVDE
jgi:DNA polymerase-3 subunit delta'